MSKLFSTVGYKKPKRTAFDLSHERKLSCKMGQLIPIMNDEIMPGDTFKVRTEVLVRLAPMIAPVMHRTNVFIHYFFVPNRIIWEDWEAFITGQEDILVPSYFSSSVIEKGSIGDYMGLPVGASPLNLDGISQLPIRAYVKIFNDYYRDQNQQAEKELVGINYWAQEPFLRAWEKDYFTSALPAKQQDGPYGVPINPNYIDSGSLAYHTDDTPADGPISATNSSLHDNSENIIIKNLVEGQESAVDINEFRIAHRLQRWAERQMRSGNRYVETLLSHWGVTNNDLRMMRPQYLGGGKMPVTISEVLNTNGNKIDDASLGSNVPLGDMAGHGIGVGSTPMAKATFKEHGWIMGIMSVIPKTTYQNGIHRSWLRKDKFQFPWPEFANFGEHAVLQAEIFATDTLEENKTVFGYQSQYSDLKYKGSSVHGDFRDNLSFYHMGRIFADTPASGQQYPPSLNEEFITCDTSAINQRVFTTGDTADTLWIQIYNAVTAIRPLPYYGTPTL